MGNSENKNFRLKPIAEFLDGKHHFKIPSYQRGYRWDQKQVQDLLKDIADFAKNAEKGDFYCLQPIVVKKAKWKNNEKVVEGWDVIDGQQRLTSILLLLKYLKNNSDDAKESSAIFYDIHYQTRPYLNFDEPDKDHDIDSYYADSAKNEIQKWFVENKVKKSKIVEVLFDTYIEKEGEKSEPQVKVIWYVVESDDEVDSIKVFNNLNKGKISLTNAELIKSLFILKAQTDDSDLNLNELTYEWNEIENSLHDERFWFFLSNTDYRPSTRIDLIFDFLTKKGKSEDSDFSYRKFQKLYDGEFDDLWNNAGKQISFTEAWEKVKNAYQTFVYWHENNTLYHYIGFLIETGSKISDIYEKCHDKSKNDVVAELKELIKIKLINEESFKIKADLDNLTYTDNYDIIKKILLLFNIESHVNQKNKTNPEFSYNKFPFDKYKNENWDIEHVASQTENPLKESKEKIDWLNYLKDIEPEDPKVQEKWRALQLRAEQLIVELKNNKKNDNIDERFLELYKEVLSIIQIDKLKKEDSITNLALLDAGTNRSYKNALFPTKRKTIIENDMKGIFIPICTKNLFLKFYTSNDQKNTQWKNNWTEPDGKAYLEGIHKKIDWFFN